MTAAKALQFFDYFIIAGYFLIVVGTAIYFSRKMKLTTDFFTAGGNIPWWLAGVSFFMASHSALAFVMYAELSYKYGIISIIMYQLTVPALILGGFFVAQRWRRARAITPVQFLEKRYSLIVKQALTWTGIPLRLVDNALRVFSTAIFLYAGLKLSIIDLPTAIGLIGLVSILYSFAGGQWGVIVTDFVQFIIQLTAVLLLLPLTIIKLGGLSAFIEAAPAGLFDPLSGPYRFLNIFSTFIILAIALNSGWSLVQKYNCVRDEKDARKVAWTVAGLNFVGPVLFFGPALLARVLLPGMENPKYCYAELSFTVLPVGMMGVMVAGMFSATLATMGSELNVLAGILTNDVYRRVVKPKASERELLVVGRITTALMGILIVLVAILISLLQGYNLFDLMMKAFGAILPATTLPILAGLFWKRINVKGALLGLVAGAISGILLISISVFLVQEYQGEMNTNPSLQYWLKQGWDGASILINVVVTIAAMYLGSRIFRTSDEEGRKIDLFFRDLAVPITVQSNTKSASISNFKVIGVSIALFGVLLALAGIGIRLFNDNTEKYGVTIFVGALLVVLGLVMYLLSYKKSGSSDQ